MEFNKMIFLFKNTAAFISFILLLKVHPEEFHGRHVCNQQQTVSQSVPVQQTYRRAVFRQDLQRVTYQTAYRTVFRMQIHAELVPGCCPGWEKRSPRDVSCLKPVCSEECENGGKCVGPGLCVCAEGYTGYRCQIDIDECSGRNTCQQKCTNSPGSYECSCQEGFKLAYDEYTCELCLNCTKEFQFLQAQIETVQVNTKQDETLQDIKRQLENLTDVKAQGDRIRNIEKQIDTLNDMAVQDDRYQEIQKQVNTLQNKIREVDTIKELNRKINTLQESSQHKEKFHEIQTQIANLLEIKAQINSIKTLNDTIKRMQEDNANSNRFDDIQRQIDHATVNNAQQNKAQVDRIEEMRKELEQVREIKAQVETFKEMKKQLDLMANRIQELETDKAALKSNLTAAVNQYEAAISAFHSKDVSTDHDVTTDPYEVDHKMPLDRLASLSQQISILEEKMADCACGQDYHGR